MNCAEEIGKFITVFFVSFSPQIFQFGHKNVRIMRAGQKDGRERERKICHLQRKSQSETEDFVQKQTKKIGRGRGLTQIFEQNFVIFRKFVTKTIDKRGIGDGE